MDSEPATPPIAFVRLALAQSPEKQKRVIESIAQALAECCGNQVHLAQKIDESPRFVRRQIERARLLGVDIPDRAKEIMQERGITPWVSIPPIRTGPRKPGDAEKLAKAAAKRDAGAQTRSKKAAKKKTAKKKVKRGASAKHPA